MYVINNYIYCFWKYWLFSVKIIVLNLLCLINIGWVVKYLFIFVRDKGKGILVILV